eukprot:3282821-Rhodomonas_salina.2
MMQEDASCVSELGIGEGVERRGRFDAYSVVGDILTTGRRAERLGRRGRKGCGAKAWRTVRARAFVDLFLCFLVSVNFWTEFVGGEWIVSPTEKCSRNAYCCSRWDSSTREPGIIGLKTEKVYDAHRNYIVKIAWRYTVLAKLTQAETENAAFY